MKQLRPYILAILTFSCINSGRSQDDPIVLHAVQSVTQAVKAFDPYSFYAQMRFKERGGDTFEIRKFRASYRANPSDLLYGYDWEISEIFETNDTLTYMIMSGALYSIYTGSKAMGYKTLTGRLSSGSFQEAMRSYFILDEVIAPYLLAPPSEISFRDSSTCFSLMRQMNELATHQLIVDKETYLPIKSISIIKGGEFDLVQILEVEFNIDEESKQLTPSAFSPDYYQSQGYELKIVEEEVTQEVERPLTLSIENQELLLSYPFISENGDTMRLSEVDSEYVLLDVWYASCLPCLKAMPEINQLSEDYADASLEIIGINCFDMGIRSNVISKLREKDITMPLLFGTRDLLRSLEINSFPSYLLITPDRKVDFIRGDVEEVKEVLDRLFDK